MQHPYDALHPDAVIDAVESQGLICDLRIYPLNSYENRVYQIGIEDAPALIGKFYRPERWSREQILEEHQFSQALKDLDLSVVAPWKNDQGETLFEHAGFYFALYPRQGGHAPETGDLDQLFSIGRALGRIHQMGKQSDFQHRPKLDIESFGRASREFLLAEKFIPVDLIPAYDSLSLDILQRVEDTFSRSNAQWIRCHGDCHIGNILWRHDTAHFVDFDDARMAPAIQDLWMLLSGTRHQQTEQLSEILEGYREFCDFDTAEIQLIEALRSLRLMQYSAWLARRWGDPAFPKAFPWFNTERYWAEHILSLREQLAAMQEPALQVY
ncbi:serine/threonine protein kinase [Pseudoteredinibacter isoporae]|uniref:Stress response kinase A n=1 Tax=Pseudoteredinibacter isoporae TaxID=570281 RepID=A0A7X0JRR0_9GAMM|nr:serine/threonine protein kinase [Pseudoteredinibacter isoporae]MBB6521083.1 Ser/Thr protein kinase RdoA (MazF antagonist) [Pseudoteredinibacter isoporae]NHO86647.1 serine/threonine protein kinase [Pseudoteredinibacter isoporae]NIB24901.1 serine/threonine protein kinase [Pseudoteredinibacter isoporae]